MEFLKAVTAREALTFINAFPALHTEIASKDESLGRIIAEMMRKPMRISRPSRSLVDG